MGRQKKMLIYASIFVSLSVIMPILFQSTSSAQQHSYAPNTDNDGGQQLSDCLQDTRKFCNAWSPLLFELENCLEDHITELSPACRSHLQNTDFRKYHRE
jgi:hypothetical protein